jgi:hypothetical protein
MALVDALTLVPDPRRRQSCRYPFTGLLAVAVVAVLRGARSPAGISRWARGSNGPPLDAPGLPQGVGGVAVQQGGLSSNVQIRALIGTVRHIRIYNINSF